jgi:Nickel responsive protein SCO4226-like
MPSYVVESYAADSQTVFDEARAQARRVEELGEGVRYVRTTFLPDDQTMLHVFEAPSAEELDRAGRLAALPYERIVVAVEGAESTEEREAGG